MGPEGLIAVWTHCSDTWFLVLCGNYVHILRLMFWDVFTEVENVMILNSMDYLSQWDLIRWNNPGRQLLVRADDSPLQFSGPRLGRGGCKAPPNPGALGSPTARRWNYIKSDHLSGIYCAWFLSLSVRLGSPSPMYNNTDRNTPHRVVQDPKKGPWPWPLWRHHSVPQKGLLPCCFITGNPPGLHCPLKCPSQIHTAPS